MTGKCDSRESDQCTLSVNILTARMVIFCGFLVCGKGARDVLCWLVAEILQTNVQYIREKEVATEVQRCVWRFFSFISVQLILRTHFKGTVA